MKTITLQEYTEGTVLRTSRLPGYQTVHPELAAVWPLGLVGEAGEIADLLKKHVGHGHPLPREKLISEVGDVCWYLTAMAWALLGPDRVEEAWQLPPNEDMEGANSLEGAALILVSDASTLAMTGDGWPRIEEFQYVARALKMVCAHANPPFAIEEAWAANEAKLLARYPNGFDPKRSQARLAPKIYVASKFRNHLAVRAAQAALRAAGCSITYDWTPHVDHPEMEADQQACALADAKGVLDADALLLIRVPEMRGAYVEMGMALAKGIPVHIVQGDRGEVAAQVFEHHPLVQHHPTVEAAVAAIYSGATTRKAA